MEWVTSDMKQRSMAHTWPTKILKSGPRKHQELIHTYSYDMADAYVISLAGILGMDP